MKTRPIELLTITLFFSAFLAFAITALDLMKVLVLSSDLKETYSDTTRWQMIIKSFGSLGTVFFSILIFTLYRNIGKREIMTRSNVKALKVYGNLMIFIALACIISINSLSLNYTMDTARYYLLMVMGGCMTFFAFAFEMGIKLKEEQDLTI